MATLTLNSRDNEMAELSVAELERVVTSRLTGRVAGFQLILESRGLVLRGTARTFYAKQMAQHLVMELSAVPIVTNGIEVINGR